VSKTMEAGRSAGTSPQLSRSAMTPAGRFLAVVACAVLILGAAIGSYFLARAADESEIKAANNRIVQLQNENQKLSADNTNHLATIADLQTQIKNVQAKLDAIMPSENTYNISPNQSLIVADGRLTIGLIGSPTNESVNLNINSKQQSVAAGTVINSVLDPSTTCRVGVQSFDMFKAVLIASCAAAKP
jgi:cell division protein FtsB